MDIKVNERTVVVFDLDDTLYNEMDYLRSAYIAIAKKLDFENWQALFSRMFSLFRTKQDVFAYLIDQYSFTKEELLIQYRNHEPSLQLFEGVLETIQKIKEKKGKIAIITDGRSSTQRTKLKALGLLNLVDKIVISEEVGSEKPDENNYRMVMESFVDHNYLYMADNLRKDFLAPNKLGWQTLGLVDNGLNMHYDGHMYFIEDHSPQQFVTSFSEINIV